MKFRRDCATNHDNRYKKQKHFYSRVPIGQFEEKIMIQIVATLIVIRHFNGELYSFQWTLDFAIFTADWEQVANLISVKLKVFTNFPHTKVEIFTEQYEYKVLTYVVTTGPSILLHPDLLLQKYRVIILF